MTRNHRLNTLDFSIIDWSRYRLHEDVVMREPGDLTPYLFKSIAVPGLGDQEFRLLLDSVRAPDSVGQPRGVNEPLIVTPQGQVVDGQARLRAAKIAGCERVPTQVLEAPDEPDYAIWAGLANLWRRHLNSPQKFAIEQATQAVLEECARARQATTRFSRIRNPRRAHGTELPDKSDKSTVPTNLLGPSPDRSGETRERMAKLLGVSASQAGKMIAITKRGSPALQRTVAAGEKSIHRAYTELDPARRAARPGLRASHQRSKGDSPENLAHQPVKTLRLVAALIERWGTEAPAWPPERRAAWKQALHALVETATAVLAKAESVA